MPAVVKRSGSLRQFNSLLRSNTTLALNDLGMGAKNRVKAPLKGSVKAAVKMERATNSKQSVRVYTNSPIAIFREVDTKPHIIRGKNSPKKLLKFKGNKGTTFKRFVMHPGTRGTHSWQHAKTQFNLRRKFAMEAVVDATMAGRRYANRYTF